MEIAVGDEVVWALGVEVNLEIYQRPALLRSSKDLIPRAIGLGADGLERDSYTGAGCRSWLRVLSGMGRKATLKVGISREAFPHGLNP